MQPTTPVIEIKAEARQRSSRDLTPKQLGALLGDSETRADVNLEIAVTLVAVETDKLASSLQAFGEAAS